MSAPPDGPFRPPASLNAKSTWEELNFPAVNLLNQTARDEERSFLLGKITEYLAVSIFVMTLVAYEWAHWYFRWQPNPFVFAILGVPLVGYALVRVWFILPKLHALRLQQTASKTMKSALEALASRGFYVFHNVSDPSGWHIGSVVVGPVGTFSVTARYASRRGEAMETVDHLDRNTVRLAGHEALADPLGQARRSSFALYGLLTAANLDTVPVQPLLAFPGWPLGKKPSGEERDVWVINEHTLEKELTGLPPVLEPKDLIGVCTVLEKFVRDPGGRTG